MRDFFLRRPPGRPAHQHIPCLRERVRCALVSRRWAALLENPAFWADASFSGAAATRLTNAAFLQLCLRSAGNLHTVKLAGMGTRKSERALGVGGVAAALCALADAGMASRLHTLSLLHCKSCVVGQQRASPPTHRPTHPPTHPNTSTSSCCITPHLTAPAPPLLSPNGSPAAPPPSPQPSSASPPSPPSPCTPAPTLAASPPPAPSRSSSAALTARFGASACEGQISGAQRV